MKIKTVKKIGFGLGAGAALTIGTLLILGFGYGLSWIIACGLIKLITLCFGWTFKWSIATGIWLVMCLLKTIFSHRSKGE